MFTVMLMYQERSVKNQINTKLEQPIPLYTRVESILRHRILSGQMEPGQKFPKEDDLAAYFGVSKITIRTALSRLKQAGLISTSRPIGTFVAENIPVPKQFVVTGGIYDIVTDSTRYQAKPLGIEIKNASEVRNSRTIREFMGLTSEDLVCVVKRIRLLEGIPIYFIENFTNPEIAEKFDFEELSRKPFLKILKEKIGLTIGRGEMFIEALPAEADLAELLQIQIFDPLIFMQVFYWFPSGKPFEIVNLFMRSEFFRYKVELDSKGFEKI
jgi:GntR family transcriptional regulator